MRSILGLYTFSSVVVCRPFFKSVCSVCAFFFLSSCSTHTGAGYSPDYFYKRVERVDGEFFSSREKKYDSAQQDGSLVDTKTSHEEVEKPQAWYSSGLAVGDSEALVSGLSDKKMDDVDLSFHDATIENVVSSILGDVLHQRFLVSSSGQGSISFSLSAPMNPKELVLALSKILRAHGYDLRFEEGTYIVSALASDRVVQGDVTGFSYLGLRYADSESVLGLLKTLFPSEAESVMADSARNRLIFKGTQAQRDYLIGASLEFDLDVLSNKKLAILPLRYASVDAVIGEVRRVFRSDMPNSFDLLPLKRLNSIVVVASDKLRIEQLWSFMQRLDSAPTTERQFRVIHLMHVDVDEVANVLNQALDNEVIQKEIQPESPDELNADFAPELRNRVKVINSRETGPAAPEKAPSVLKGGSAPAGLSGLGQAGAEANGGESKVTSLPNGVKVIAYKRTNTLLVYGTEAVFEKIKSIVNRLDVAPDQVLIDATILEVTLNRVSESGLQGVLKNIINNLATGSMSSLSFNSLKPLTEALPGYNFVFKGNDLDLIVNSLRRVSDVRVLSSPKVVAEDNHPATLQVGDEIPILTTTVTDTGTATTSNAVEYRQTGLVLRVTPHINRDSEVVMDILQEITTAPSASDGGTTSAASLTPRLSRRSINTRAAVHSGQAIALGGLISEELQEGEDGAPGFHAIPFIGRLLSSHRASTLVRKELLVLLMPRVIHSMRDTSEVMHNLLNDFNMLFTKREADSLRLSPKDGQSTQIHHNMRGSQVDGSAESDRKQPLKSGVNGPKGSVLPPSRSELKGKSRSKDNAPPDSVQITGAKLPLDDEEEGSLVSENREDLEVPDVKESPQFLGAGEDSDVVSSPSSEDHMHSLGYGDAHEKVLASLPQNRVNSLGYGDSVSLPKKRWVPVDFSTLVHFKNDHVE